MPDIEYTYGRVDSDYGIKTVWNAVYFKLTPANTHDQPALMIDSLVKRWRRRASVLKKAGYEPFKGKKIQYVRNCPPLGIRVATPGRACHTKPCPFCWGRRSALKLWHRFCRAAFESKSHPRTKPIYDILQFRTLQRFEDVDEARRVGERDRNLESGQVESAGSGVIVTIEPGPDCFVMRRAGVLLVERHVEIPEFDDNTEVKLREGGVLSRGELVKGMGSIAKYPEGLMREDPERVIEVINATSGMRQLSFAGLMNKKTRT